MGEAKRGERQGKRQQYRREQIKVSESHKRGEKGHHTGGQQVIGKPSE